MKSAHIPDSMTLRNDIFRMTRVSGDIDVEFQTDANGSFIYQNSVYGGGSTVYTDGYIRAQYNYYSKIAFLNTIK